VKASAATCCVWICAISAVVVRLGYLQSTFSFSHIVLKPPFLINQRTRIFLALSFFFSHWLKNEWLRIAWSGNALDARYPGRQEIF